MAVNTDCASVCVAYGRTLESVLLRRRVLGCLHTATKIQFDFNFMLCRPQHAIRSRRRRRRRSCNARVEQTRSRAATRFGARPTTAGRGDNNNMIYCNRRRALLSLSLLLSCSSEKRSWRRQQAPTSRGQAERFPSMNPQYIRQTPNRRSPAWRHSPHTPPPFVSAVLWRDCRTRPDRPINT